MLISMDWDRIGNNLSRYSKLRIDQESQKIHSIDFNPIANSWCYFQSNDLDFKELSWDPQSISIDYFVESECVRTG